MTSHPRDDLPTPDVLYVSDLDGTLLTDEPRLSEYSMTTLTELLLEELPFSIATARSVVSMRMVLGDLPLRLPVISFNGAFLSDLRSGRHEVINSLETELGHEVYDLIAADGHAPIVSTYDGTQDCVYFSGITNEGVSWYHRDRTSKGDPRVRQSEHPKQPLHDEVAGITVIDQSPALLETDLKIRAHAGGAVSTHLFENAYSRGWHWLTVHDRRATKDQGVQTLREGYGFVDAELVVFGDEANDESLFRIADRAVAVENASPVLEPVTSERIGSNESDSVAEYIRADWLGRRS